MKRWYGLFLGLILWSGALSCSYGKSGPETLSVLAWNIWHAGHSKAYGETACNAVAEILRTSGADVVLVVETYGADTKLADALGYYHRSLSNNLSVYSRYPIRKTHLFPDSISTFNFGGVEIDVAGQKVRVFDMWIHYLPDASDVPTGLTGSELLAWEKSGTRDEETARILSVLRPFIDESDSVPVIVGGDFNSHSHLDWTEATKDLFNHGGAVVAWPVSRMMAEAGFIDSFREMNPDPVIHIGTTWMTNPQAEPNRQDRIDYIYYQGKNIRAVASQCEDCLTGKEFRFRGKTFFYPSDHGFVYTKFRLDKN